MNPLLKNALVIGLTTIVGVVVISSGYFFWRDHEVIQPLHDYLQTHEQVTEYRITEQNDDFKIFVQLDYSPFLYRVYQDLVNELQNRQGENKISIELMSENSTQLDQAAYQLTFLLRDKAHTGKYVKLWEILPELEDQYQLDHIQVHFVDKGYFIQMQREDNNLVDIVEYPHKLREDESIHVDSS